MKKYIFLLFLFWAMATLVSAQNITRLEYNIDGFVAEGKGTMVEITGNEMELDSSFDIDISGLEPGIHTIHFRSMNENGVWSFPAERTFYVTEPPITDGIVAIEYSIDKVLKEGSGTLITFNKATNQIDSSMVFDIANLKAGTHNIYFRAQNKLGEWSLPANRTFVVVEPDTIKIEKIFYRFFNDDYQGIWMALDVEPAQKQIDSTVAASVLNMELGKQYTIELYAKNNLGVRGYSTYFSPVDLRMNNSPESMRDSLSLEIMANQVKGVSMDSLFTDLDLNFGDKLVYSISDSENNDLSVFSDWETPSLLKFSPHNDHQGQYNFWITATDAAWEKDSIKVMLTVTGTTGIEANSEDNPFTVYPNPAGNYTTVRVNSSSLLNGYNLKLYNSTGQLLKTEFVNTQEHRLQLNKLTKGMYIVVLQNSEFMARKKIIHE
jgi:hypothetical protein